MGDNLILDLATDYSDYLKIDFKKEIGSLEEVIEDTLTRLEEFESVVDMGICSLTGNVLHYTHQSGGVYKVSAIQLEVRPLIAGPVSFLPKGLQHFLTSYIVGNRDRTDFEVLSRSEELKSLFMGIRKLEALVSLIRQDVEQAEAQLTEAEATTKGSDGKFRSLLKPLFFKKPSLNTSASRSDRSPSYEAPHLFSTTDFFPDHQTETT